MAENTKIQWTDATWNPVTGCSKISAGCKNCYAETIANRFWGDRKFTDVQCHEDRLLHPLKRKKPTMYFVNSMSDLFHEDVPVEFIDKVFAVMALCPQHTFQVLTKRPERMADYLTTPDQHNSIELAADTILPGQGRPEFGRKHLLSLLPLPNVWLGTSTENQKQAEERIPHLVRCLAVIRFVSFEPLLGPIDPINLNSDAGDFWNQVLFDTDNSIADYIHWAIIGGESGPNARPCHVDWVRSLVQQCRDAEVSVFVKQLGSNVWIDYYGDDGTADWSTQFQRTVMQRVQGGYTEWDHQTFGQPSPGSKVRVHLRDPKGGAMEEWPEDLRVREMPCHTS